jgi:TetR/AcrR family transcriptional regulator, fatty acid biosynthesis regulator
MGMQANIAKPLRRRLSPDVRRNQILDVAAALVTSEGLTAVNMERIAREASVSKALVYSYFGSQVALLSELLLREYGAFQQEAHAAAQKVSGLEAIVRATTRAYLDHVAARGSLIQRLMIEPTISARLNEVENANRLSTVAYFADLIALDRRVDRAQASIAAQLLMGLTGAAGDYLVSTRADPAALEPVVVSMIMASLNGLAAR